MLLQVPMHGSAVPPSSLCVCAGDKLHMMHVSQHATQIEAPTVAEDQDVAKEQGQGRYQVGAAPRGRNYCEIPGKRCIATTVPGVILLWSSSTWIRSRGRAGTRWVCAGTGWKDMAAV